MSTLLKGACRLAASQTVQSQRLRRMGTIREIKIPVPWGYIAGRESGPEDGKPLLMLHGWLDNCGTFDGIQANLPPQYRCVNIDIPGHGLSSHIPDGMKYGFMQGVIFIRLVREHLGWSRFSIVGHSMGSGMGMLYAATFPEEVESLAILDLVKFITRPVEMHPGITRDSVLTYIENRRKTATQRRPQYSYDELRRRLIAALSDDVEESAADALLVRGARRDAQTGLYEYTYDLRHRERALQPISMDQWQAYGSKLRCRLLVLLAEEGGSWIGPREEAEALATYEAAVPYLRVERVPGGHHVHLTHPDRMLPVLNGFLESEEVTPAKSSEKVKSGL